MLAEFQVLDSPSPESEEGMTSAPERFTAIDKRIEDLEKKVHAISKQDWWPVRLYNLAVNHKGTSLILAIILCIAGIYGGGYFRWWLDHRKDASNKDVDDRIKLILNAPKGVSETLQGLQATTYETNTTLKTLQPFIQDVIAHQFENVSQLPTRTLLERLPAVNDLLATAKDQNVKVNSKVVTDTGARLVRSSTQNQAAWKTALSFVDYRSFLNADFQPNLGQLTPSPASSAGCQIVFFSRPLPPNFSISGKWETAFRVYQGGGTASAEKSAKLEDIRKPQPLCPGVGFFVLDEMDHRIPLVLDYSYMRNVIIRNAIVDYDGGPIRLENVYFVNCTFIMKSQHKTQNLALALLSTATSTTFSA